MKRGWILLVIVIGIALVVWEWWLAAGLVIVAAVFFKFTIVREGTAKIIIRLGKFKKAVMVWGGHKLDAGNNVVQGDTIRLLLGGLVFVGIRLIDKVYKYKFRWRDIQLVKSEEKVEFHEEQLDYIFVRPDVYWTDIKGAETAPPERIPINVQFLVTMRVSNPERAVFKAPSNWNENVMSRLNALFRSWVATKTLDKLLDIHKDPQKIWKDFKDEALLKKTFQDEWGITIEENGIEIRTIDLPPDYQTAAAAQKKLELEAVARSAETVGTVIEMMARVRGKKVKDIQKEIEAQPEMRREFLDLAKDLIVRKLGIEGKSYLDIRVQGAEGIEKTILNALAVWQRIPTGKPSEREEKKEDAAKKPKKEELEKPVKEERKKTKEEIRKEMEKEMEK